MIGRLGRQQICSSELFRYNHERHDYQNTPQTEGFCVLKILFKEEAPFRRVFQKQRPKCWMSLKKSELRLQSWLHCVLELS